MRVFKPNKMSDFEEYVRLQSNIVRIIGEYVDLQKKGRRYVGRCPFHPQGVNKELGVYPDKGEFMCWSAGCCHGNVFDFIAKMTGVGRNEAVEVLAQKLGISANLFYTLPQRGLIDRSLVSFSVLKLFQQCPLRYKHKYLDGNQDEKTTPYLTLGRIIHQTLADFFRRDIGNRSLQTLFELLNIRWKSDSFEGRDEVIEYRTRAEEMLANYFHTHDCNADAWKIEASIKWKLKGLTLIGTVDRVDRLTDGTCAIIDYKTASIASYEEDKMQLAFYYYGVLETYQIPISKLVLEYLGSQETISMSPSEAALEEQMSRAHCIAKQITTATDFAPTRNPYCSDCTLASACLALRNTV